MALQPIPSLPAYYATEDGRIFKYRRKDDNLFEISQNSKSNSGYRLVQPYKDGKKLLKYVHQLVLEAFEGPRPEGLVCDHIDRNKENNHIDNLRYVTQKENNNNRILTNVGAKKGQKFKQHMTPIKVKYAAQITQSLKEGKTLQVIADELGISVTSVYHASKSL